MWFCAQCQVKGCSKPLALGDNVVLPAGCPTLKLRQEDIIGKYTSDPDEFNMARSSAICSPDHTEHRLAKTMRFAKMCGFDHLGLAFCNTLSKEAEAVAAVLVKNGFKLDSANCKVGRENREKLGAYTSKNPMCNPICQAELLNEAGTQLNIVLGLCVGHDSLFIKHSKAPVTVLACKDHVYDNAPLRALEDCPECEFYKADKEKSD